MRLLTVGSLPPEWGGGARGGVATFHAALLRGLAARDEVEILGVVPPAPVSGQLGFPVFSRPDGLDLAGFYEGLLQSLEPDAVLMNHVANTIGVTHARLAGPPPALGVAHSWHSITFREGEERARARAVTDEALAGLAALVCPSLHCLHEGKQLGLTYPATARTIHYPLQPLYQEGGIDVDAGERGGVLYVGSLVERKNPAGLVEAAALLPGLAVTLVGEGDEEAGLRERIAALGLARRVRISQLPGVDHLGRLRDAFLSAQVLCLPSRSESFGIVFIEALACGTPVVGFGPTVREIREAMGIEIGEPIDDPSPEAIAGAVERVVAGSWDRSELRRAALACFDLDTAVGRYLDVLQASGGSPAQK